MSAVDVKVEHRSKPHRHPPMDLQQTWIVEAVHALEDQFKLVLGKIFCKQEPMTRSDEFGDFVIVQAARR